MWSICTDICAGMSADFLPNFHYSSQIQELMLYEFKLGHDAVEETKNISCTIGEDTVDHCSVTRLLKRLCLSCKNLKDQARLVRPKTMDSKAVFQAIEANLVISNQAQHLTVQCGSSSS